MRDRWIILFGVLIFFFCLWQVDLHDRKAFPCLLREEKGRRAHPTFIPAEEYPPAYVARGSVACVEDVVAFANERRAGQDGVIGTDDDDLTVEEQLELLSATLEYNFLGSFWIHSPFFPSYEHYGSAILTQVLFADVDELLLLRVAPAGTSFVVSTRSEERHIFPLDGLLSVQRGAPLRPLLLTSKQPKSAQRLTASSPLEVNAYRIRPGRKELFGTPEARGVVYLEHIITHVPRASISVYAFTAIFSGWDFASAATSLTAIYQSLYRNALLPMWHMFWEGDERGQLQEGHSERLQRKAEYQAAVDCNETLAEEQFNESRREMQKAAQLGVDTREKPAGEDESHNDTPLTAQPDSEDSDAQEEEDDEVVHDEL